MSFLHRGRRQPYQGFTSSSANRPAPQQLPKPVSGQVRLATFDVPGLRDTSPSDLPHHIADVTFVSSYNWIENRDPVITIPGKTNIPSGIVYHIEYVTLGKPPKWLPPATTPRLVPDSGEYYRDPNSARYPRFPIEPAVRSIFEVDDAFDCSNIDIFGCGNTLGSLLSFVWDEDRTFRFGVERVGPTLFLIRKTNVARELIKDVRGYGHSFPEAYTVWEPQVRGSASHQRLIKYDFGGLRCIIRSECDGYLPSKAPYANLSQASSRATNESDLLSGGVSLSGLSVTPDHRLSTANLVVRKAGESMPQAAVFDLKTRSIMRKPGINLSEFLPRLWLNQTPNFILAWHRAGHFTKEDIEIKDVRDDIARWQRSNADLLSKFHHILRKLIAFSDEDGHEKYEVRRSCKGKLEIWSEVDGFSALPAELNERWAK